MQIENKRAVALEYELTVDGGIVVDKSDSGEPLWYLHGVGNLIPGLESALVGMKTGDAKTVVVPAEAGYGDYQEDRVHKVPKEQFGPDTTFEIGDRVAAQDPDGGSLPARISGVDPKEVTLDFNHELAGKELTFKVKVAEVREASKEELQHGHVHGPGGHHH